MKIPLNYKGSLLSAPKYVDFDTCKCFDVSSPIAMRQVIDDNPLMFTKEEKELLHSLLKTYNPSNFIIAFQIIDAKPEIE